MSDDRIEMARLRIDLASALGVISIFEEREKNMLEELRHLRTETNQLIKSAYNDGLKAGQKEN